MKKLLFIASALAGLLLAGGPAAAHPHVWIVFTSEIVFDARGTATGIRHAWTFDDMYTAFALQGLESKEKGKFTREELAPLAEVNVTSLKELDFFTYASVNGQKIELKDASDYWLEYKDQVLTLYFTLPFRTPARAKTVDLEIYDPTYFVDFALAEKEPAKLAGAPAACKVAIGKPQEMTKEMAQRLAQIPPSGAIPADSYGAQFANKISVKCP
jgi:ABC-type uncharacterized transport system substrate-binding protein